VISTHQLVMRKPHYRDQDDQEVLAY